MKFCIKCGTKLPDEAVFCSKCGLKQPDMPEDIDNSFVQSQVPVNAEQGVQYQMPFPMQQPFMPVPQFYNTPDAQGIYAPMPQPPQNPPPFFQAPQVPPYFIPQYQAFPNSSENVEKHLKITLFFVWSLILIFIINPIGTPLAIISALFAGMARSSDATYEHARKNLEVSKAICVIATIIDALCILTVIVLLIYSMGTGNTIVPSGSGTQV